MNKWLIFVLVCIYRNTLAKGLNINQHLLKVDPSDLLWSILEFITSISNEEVFKAKECLDCLNALIEASKKTDSFKATLNYCGKDLSDQGQEMECLRSNSTTFFLFKYELNLSDEYFQNENISDNKIIQFLNAPEIYTGFCMYNECMRFIIQHYFNSTENLLFFSFLHASAHISNISFAVEENFKFLTGNKKKYDKIGSLIFLLITTFSISVFGIMVIISLLRMLYSMFSEESRDSILSTEEAKSSNKSMSLSEVSKDASEDSQSSNREDWHCGAKPRRLYNALKLVDFFHNASYLFGVKNKYYNDEGLEVLSFARGIAMFLIVYFYICYSLLVLPPQDPYNIIFYTSPMFFLVKLSSFSTVCWIILDSTTVSYKLMATLKKNKSSQTHIPFSLFCKFALNSVPTIFLVLLIFFYLYYLGVYFSDYFQMGILFEHFFQKLIATECDASSFSSIFLCPIINNKERNQPLFYLNVYRNELFCFIIALLGIFISFKLRSKIYDYLVLILVFINCGLAFFEIPNLGKSYSKKPITFLFVLGQNFTFNDIQLFISIYLMGIFVGICYFYHNDMLSQSPLYSMDDDELPFYFCFWIANKCDRLRYAYKNSCLIILCLLALLLSFSFTFIQCFNGQRYLLNGFDIVLHAYEKNIFGFIFCWILLFLLIHPKDTSFKHLIHSNIFLPLSRITTAFFCICKFVVYTSISTFNFKISLTYSDFFSAAIALLILSIIMSIVITVIYEMPMRILRKYLTKSKTTSKNNTTTTMSYENSSSSGQSSNHAFKSQREKAL